MKNYDLIEEFLSRTTERYWDEAMLEDKNYLVPKDKICDYVRSIIRIPYRDFLAYLRDNPSTESIESKNITQCSSFVACERDMCKILERENNPGFSYEQIGQLLKDKTGSNSLDAYKKYGENQIKTSQQLGLAFEYFGDWYLSSLGYVYLMLSPTEQHSLLARTLLRDCLYAQIVKDLSTTNVDLLSYMKCISSDSTKARRYGCVEFLVKMCIEECNREGTNIYSIKPRTSFQKKKDEWIVKNYSHYLPIATKNNENLPIHLSRRAHIPTSNEGSYKDKYISLITSVPLLTESEEKNLFLQYKGGDESAYQAICEACLPTIYNIAYRYEKKYPFVDIQDLIGESIIALCRALESFNPAYNVRLISYALRGIRLQIQEYIFNYTSLVRLPINQRALCEKVNDTYDKFYTKNERRPSAKELAEILDIPIDKIADSLKLFSPVNEGLDSNIIIDNLDSECYADDIFYYESLFIEVQSALNLLTPREADIIRKFFGIGVPEKTLEELGIELNLMRERVRQIKEKAIRKLKTSSRACILMTYLGGDHLPYLETTTKNRIEFEKLAEIEPTENENQKVEITTIINRNVNSTRTVSASPTSKVNKKQEKLEKEIKIIEEQIKKIIKDYLNTLPCPTEQQKQIRYIYTLISETRKVLILMDKWVLLWKKIPSRKLLITECNNKDIITHLEQNFRIIENSSIAVTKTIEELRIGISNLRHKIEHKDQDTSNLLLEELSFKKGDNVWVLKGKYKGYKGVIKSVTKKTKTLFVKISHIGLMKFELLKFDDVIKE